LSSTVRDERRSRPERLPWPPSYVVLALKEHSTASSRLACYACIPTASPSSPQVPFPPLPPPPPPPSASCCRQGIDKCVVMLLVRL
jgi:hypothetical protein